LSVPSKYRFTAWIFSFEENLAIKNAPPIVRLCLTIGVHFIWTKAFLLTPKIPLPGIFIFDKK
ncbi:hypothetical protein P4I74_08410, partial [Bacillus cereus]|nr:hypothetical protein [Bacillus cereus]